ncbi:MAG: hypothetical protein ACKVQU_17965 [Burkholderiales bacterium]
MKNIRHIGTALLLVTLVGCAAIAQQGSGLKLSSADIMKMDLNKDGKLTKDEYLLVMGKMFDAHAGAKGYCTPDEGMAVMRELQDFSFLNKYSN